MFSCNIPFPVEPLVIRQRRRRALKSYCRQTGCPGRRRCRACRNACARVQRPRHADLTPEQRQRANARSYANVYQRRGLLVPQPCEVCGDLEVEKHHDDYAQPLIVRWLCRTHHRALRA